MKELFIDSLGVYFVFEGVEIRDPLLSTCGREEYGNSKNEHILKDYGFSWFYTGGGCTAWHQDFIYEGKPVFMLISNFYLSAERENYEPMQIGVFTGSEVGEGDCIYQCFSTELERS
jgi:hypothetical protein